MTASAQASSRFGSHTKDGFRLAGVSWGFFPSLQLGWILTNEKWFKPTRNVNYLKATFGIEKNGNDNLDYYAARTYWETAQVFENVFGKYLSNIANSELQWETVRKINVGVEGSFLNNRLNGRVDLYWNKTSDMLSMRDLSDQYYYSGITNFWTNEGEMTNSGVEVKVNGALINSKDWKWELGATLGHYSNEVTALPESKDNTIELYKRDGEGGAVDTQAAQALILMQEPGQSADVIFMAVGEYDAQHVLAFAEHGFKTRDDDVYAQQRVVREHQAAVHQDHALVGLPFLAVHAYLAMSAQRCDGEVRLRSAEFIVHGGIVPYRQGQHKLLCPWNVYV